MSLEPVPLLRYNQLFSKPTLNRVKSEDCVERTELLITERKRPKIVFSKPADVSHNIQPETCVDRTELFVTEPEEKPRTIVFAKPAIISHQTTRMQAASPTTMDSSEWHDQHQDEYYSEDGAIQQNLEKTDVSELETLHVHHPQTRQRFVDPRVFARNLHYVYFEGPRHRKVYLGIYSVRNGTLVCESVREVDPFGERHPDFGPRPTFMVPPSHYYQYQQRRHLQQPRKHSL